MKQLLACLSAILLAGCASFSGVGGGFRSTDTVAIAAAPANFYDEVVEIGQELGYQHAGGDRASNSVQLMDQPNLGESMMGRAYRVSVGVRLLPGGRDIELLYVATGGRATTGADRSQRRISELKAALQARYGSR
jgi:hypothetical protein